ncbi:isochorismate synthase MenF [Lysinibacillus alkalisoli]|uniref:isochorismate synthase n=1 Tax=Lysinibacillus alkalisoli TaxID=1911548 RepID=A0A917G9I0_9BACI|nr:isochorismate synthase [Lysinibacillus alkalisoli]GGG30475.1 isochorismate synthase MenF [Lysinibacillus alkalisoli]
MQQNASDVTLYVTTMEVTTITPLQFFSASDMYKGQRYFWQNREATLTIVGVGNVLTLTGTDNRFNEIEKQWKAIHIHANQEQPILFGGVTFDQLNDKKSEWGDFPQALFVVAKYQFIQKGQQCFMNIQSTSPITAKDQAEAEAFLAAIKTATITLEKPKMIAYTEPEKEAYLQAVKEVTTRIRNKEADKVVLARTLALQFENQVQPAQLISDLLKEQPDCYIYGLEFGQRFFTGASPERLVHVAKHHAYSACVAGSIKRGVTAAEDEVLGYTLLHDDKNGGEHQHVVDMIADTFKAHCTTYKVPKQPQLLKSRDIQHLYTPVEGVLKAQKTILQLAKDLHPTPALGGVPRNKAMAIIRQHEAMNREMYASPIGWLDTTGDGEFAVALRCALIHDKQAYLYAGGGIVADSEPQSEYEETLVKFRPMLRALGGDLHE